jgi:D-alanyl-D-alanine carboxypeptidase
LYGWNVEIPLPKNKMTKKSLLIAIIISFTVISHNVILAQDMGEQANVIDYNIRLDLSTIEKGYTVSSFENKIKLSLVPGILTDATDVELKNLQENLEMPWSLDKISDVYQFEFKNKQAYDNHKPFYIQLNYDRRDNKHKQVFFFDKNFSAWRPLPTTDYPEAQFVRSLIHLPFARIAVFSFPDILTIGKASWYNHKGGSYAASPDFPKGSRIRVTNLDNSKFVDVEINDFGPNRNLFPDRVIDLDKPAFLKIASLGEGIINIKIEPLFIAPGANSSILSIPGEGIKSKPVISTKSAVIMSEDSGTVLWSKNSTTTLPLASLTKIIAVKVFLEQNISLDKEVAYKAADAEHNYEFCKVWESAKLSIVEDETLTVEDLIFTSLVGSTNNTIETLVRVSGLDRQAFINRMNEYVESIGAKSTHFIEPTGLAPENVSSALDYAIISRDALKNDLIAKASSIQEYKFTTINKKNAHRIKNTNQILRENRFHITGSKTGYLDEASYCLMVRTRDKDGRSLIVVTLGSATRPVSFGETTTLINYGSRLLSL